MMMMVTVMLRILMILVCHISGGDDVDSNNNEGYPYMFMFSVLIMQSQFLLLLSFPIHKIQRLVFKLMHYHQAEIVYYVVLQCSVFYWEITDCFSV